MKGEPMYTEPYETSDYKYLIDAAKRAAERAYCPYSGFRVGAALLTSDGNISTGCNVENRSYGATICAERTAAVKAISEGRHNFNAVAVVGYYENHESDDTMTYCMPCGICRQFIAEFAVPADFIIIVTDNKSIKIYTLDELLPEAF
jgi:cytidine deaminase